MTVLASSCPELAQEAGRSAVDILHANNVAGKFTLVTWNVNGIERTGSEEDFVYRMISICESIIEASAAIVFLQEVVESALKIIERMLGIAYHILAPMIPASSYFCVMLLQKSKVEPVGNFEVQNYPGSTMGRHLLKQKVRIDAAVAGITHDLQIMTTHLESTQAKTSARKKQLQMVLDEMVLASVGGLGVIAGGDFNIKDSELEKVRVPFHMVDAWEACGACESERWTWDGLANDTCVAIGCKERQFRFDRIWFCPALEIARKIDLKYRCKAYALLETGKALQGWQLLSFSLMGKLRVADRDIFPSDHWGLCVLLHLPLELAEDGALEGLTKFADSASVVSASDRSVAGPKKRGRRKIAETNLSHPSASSSSSSSSSLSSSSSSSSVSITRAHQKRTVEQLESKVLEAAFCSETHIPLASAGNREYEARTTCEALLRKALASAGASVHESAKWAAAIESSAWAHVQVVSGAASESHGYKDLPAALRLYRGEVRRFSVAARDPFVTSALFARLRTGSLEASTILALPAEELLPNAKRARLKLLRDSARSIPDREDLPFRSGDLMCVECGESGNTRYGHLPGLREGYGNPDSWGSNENESRGERCRAQCMSCLAEWTFEQ